jgi:hypothetical protein
VDAGKAVILTLVAIQIRMMHAAGERPANIARRLGVARSSVNRMLIVEAA